MRTFLFAAAVLMATAAYAQRQASQFVENQVNNKIETTMSENKSAQGVMEEVQAYLKECGTFYIATVDGDQPRVRPFGVSEIINGRLYIMTGKVKDVFKQMANNGKFEICALKPSGTEWIRISGTLVNDDDIKVKEEFLNRNPGLKSMYKADDGNMAVLYVTEGTARFCSFAALNGKRLSEKSVADKPRTPCKWPVSSPVNACRAFAVFLFGCLNRRSLH